MEDVQLVLHELELLSHLLEVRLNRLRALTDLSVLDRWLRSESDYEFSRAEVELVHGNRLFLELSGFVKERFHLLAHALVAN